MKERKERKKKERKERKRKKKEKRVKRCYCYSFARNKDIDLVLVSCKL